VDEAHHRVSPAGFKYYVTEMLCQAAGGPQQYSGRSMEDSHRHLGITEEEWGAFMDDLQQTLNKFDVPPPEPDEVEARKARLHNGLQHGMTAHEHVVERRGPLGATDA